MRTWNWLYLCLQLAHATEIKEDEDKGDRGVLFLCYHLFTVMQTTVKEISK